MKRNDNYSARMKKIASSDSEKMRKIAQESSKSSKISIKLRFGRAKKNRRDLNSESDRLRKLTFKRSAKTLSSCRMKWIR